METVGAAITLIVKVSSSKYWPRPVLASVTRNWIVAVPVPEGVPVINPLDDRFRPNGMGVPGGSVAYICGDTPPFVASCADAACPDTSVTVDVAKDRLGFWTDPV